MIQRPGASVKSIEAFAVVLFVQRMVEQLRHLHVAREGEFGGAVVAGMPMPTVPSRSNLAEAKNSAAPSSSQRGSW